MMPTLSPAQPLPHLPAAARSSQTLASDYATVSSLRRMALHQQPKPLILSSEFNDLILQHLPEVAAFLDESDLGYLHLEVGALKQATRKAFEQSNFASVRKHLLLVADLFERADASLYDALRISYLEALFLNETTAAHIVARGMLSAAMENALRQAESKLEKHRLELQACRTIA